MPNRKSLELGFGPVSSQATSETPGTVPTMVGRLPTLLSPLWASCLNSTLITGFPVYSLPFYPNIVAGTQKGKKKSFMSQQLSIPDPPGSPSQEMCCRCLKAISQMETRQRAAGRCHHPSKPSPQPELCVCLRAYVPLWCLSQSLCSSPLHAPLILLEASLAPTGLSCKPGRFLDGSFFFYFTFCQVLTCVLHSLSDCLNSELDCFLPGLTAFSQQPPDLSSALSKIELAWRCTVEAETGGSL